jgi:hypothetical protein
MGDRWGTEEEQKPGIADYLKAAFVAAAGPVIQKVMPKKEGDRWITGDEPAQHPPLPEGKGDRWINSPPPAGDPSGNGDRVGPITDADRRRREELFAKYEKQDEENRRRANAELQGPGLEKETQAFLDAFLKKQQLSGKEYDKKEMLDLLAISLSHKGGLNPETLRNTITGLEDDNRRLVKKTVEEWKKDPVLKEKIEALEQATERQLAKEGIKKGTPGYDDKYRERLEQNLEGAVIRAKNSFQTGKDGELHPIGPAMALDIMKGNIEPRAPDPKMEEFWKKWEEMRKQDNASKGNGSKRAPIEEGKENKSAQPGDGLQERPGKVSWKAIEDYARTTMAKLTGDEPVKYVDAQVQQVAAGGAITKGGPSMG